MVEMCVPLQHFDLEGFLAAGALEQNVLAQLLANEKSLFVPLRIRGETRHDVLPDADSLIGFAVKVTDGRVTVRSATCFQSLPASPAILNDAEPFAKEMKAHLKRYIR